MPEPKKKVVPINPDATLFVPNEESAPQTVFHDTSGGGGGDGTMTVDMKDYVDAKNEALESRVGGQFAALRADIKSLTDKKTTWSAVGVTVGLLLAALAIAGDRFDGGFSAAGLFAAEVEKNRATMEDLRQEVSQTQEDVSKILGAVEVLAKEHEKAKGEQGEESDNP